MITTRSACDQALSYAAGELARQIFDRVTAAAPASVRSSPGTPFARWLVGAGVKVVVEAMLKGELGWREVATALISDLVERLLSSAPQRRAALMRSVIAVLLCALVSVSVAGPAGRELPALSEYAVVRTWKADLTSRSGYRTAPGRPQMNGRPSAR